MRAIQQRALGGADVLELADVPLPEPRDGEVLVRVSRVGVNFTDTQMRTVGFQTMVDDGGRPGRLSPEDFPVIPGGEVAGTVDGRRVVALCGTGGYAEYVVARADRVFDLPDGLEDGEALALFVQGLTAWHLCRTCAGINGGESIVIHGGSGGVGSLAVQLAKLFGAAPVIATASTEEKRALARELGATVAVDSDPVGLAERLRTANDGRGVDVVLDLAGGDVFEQSLDALAIFGRLVAYGTASGRPGEVSTRSLIVGSRAVIGFWLMDCFRAPAAVAASLAEVFGYAVEGKLRPLVGRTYALSEAGQAQLDVGERRTVGKVLLDPNP